MHWKFKLIIGVLVVLILAANYRLWVGEGSFAEVRSLKQQIKSQRQQLAQLEARNEALRAEVDGLKTDDDALESRARGELGLIRDGETYFQIIPRETVGD